LQYELNLSKTLKTVNFIGKHNYQRMKKIYKNLIFSTLCLILSAQVLTAQVTIKGKVQDADTGEDLIGASIGVLGGGGAVTNYEGDFTVKANNLPTTLKISYTGYIEKTVEVTSDKEKINIKLATNAILIEEAVVRGQRIDEQEKKKPLDVGLLDGLAIKQTAAISFYSGLGNLKGVDMTTASMGFTVINMRGFNSTSPVRSLQIIDGVDNQAPGLNFSLGNFLGASELDVNRVELIAGASGPFYGPNAFNGVISIESKNPFIHKGLGVSLKKGERELFEGSIRWAQSLKNKKGSDFFAYKLNFYHLRAYDWVADNYDPVGGTKTGKNNPGGYDAVNRYGDEYQRGLDLTSESPWAREYGLGIYHRRGYNEVDLVDYNTRNYKANAALHFRLQPSKDFDSPELILASNFGSGTTVYQGDNRFSLKDILFLQNRIEIRKKDTYFVRAYVTNEDAGNSYDPYFTALKLQTNAKSDIAYQSDYSKYWGQIGKFHLKMKDQGYPQLEQMFVDTFPFVISTFDYEAGDKWINENNDSLRVWHTLSQIYASGISTLDEPTRPYFEPGSPEFKNEFNRLTKTKSGSAGGTKFYDKSSLAHVHGEYRFKPNWANYWVVGANYRKYMPYSAGTIFTDSTIYQRDAVGKITDSTIVRITNSEVGFYTGAEKKFFNDKFIFTGTVRADKNENFKMLVTPALSLVYNPDKKNFLRFSFSSAIRNPTLTDQFLRFNVGRAILLGNLYGIDSLITVESFVEGISGVNLEPKKFKYFSAPPIKPEKVKTFELGYRTTLFNRVYMDAGYYFNIYTDFIGYNIGIKVPVNQGQVDIQKLQAYRVSANSQNTVTTQGFNVGINYYFRTFYQLSANYSWNVLNKLSVDDPIIPAFNTPKHKYNIGLSGKDIKIGRFKETGFNITYKWIQGFIFEGSPQFTGKIPTYDMVDAQWSVTLPKINTTFKFGASNIFGFAPLFRETEAGQSKLKAMFNNAQYQTYGGPRIGRMAYVSAIYNFVGK
jgi:iron complex outermembrane recepter protein